MNVQHVAAVIHTPEQAREIIREALSIADDFDRDSEVWRPVFDQACALLGARASTFLQAQQVEVERYLPSPNGRR